MGIYFGDLELMRFFYPVYLVADIIFSVLTLPEYRRIHGHQFVWIGGNLAADGGVYACYQETPLTPNCFPKRHFAPQMSNQDRLSQPY